MVYAQDKPGVFARITGFFERSQFDIAAARIYTTGHGFALDGFQVLSQVRAGEHYRDLIHKVETGLAAALDPATPLGPPPTGRISRWVKHFPIEPKVEILRTRDGAAWQVFAACAEGYAEYVVADVPDHARLDAGARARHGLVGALAAGHRRKSVTRQRLTGARQTGSPHHQIHIDAAKDDDGHA